MINIKKITASEEVIRYLNTPAQLNEGHEKKRNKKEKGNESPLRKYEVMPTNDFFYSKGGKKYKHIINE